MGSSVYANKRTIVHAGDGLTFIAAAPDVCKTPSPGGPVPVPYPNTAKSSDLAKGTKKVKLEGKSAAIKGANLSTSTGDEAGTAGGGIMSSKTKGKVVWMAQSMDVKFEGKGVIRFLDPNMHNGNMGNSVGVDGGAPGGGNIDKPKCPICGKAFDGHKDVIPKPSDESDAAAKEALAPSGKKGKPRKQWSSKQKYQANNYMVSALVIDCQGSGPQVITMGAGDSRNPLTQSNFKSTAVNVNNKQPIGSVKTPTGSNPVGNCGEQAAAYKARDKFPLGPNCKASVSAYTNPGGEYTPPCDTCKDVLTAMFCDDGDPPASSHGNSSSQGNRGGSRGGKSKRKKRKKR